MKQAQIPVHNCTIHRHRFNVQPLILADVFAMLCICKVKLSSPVRLAVAAACTRLWLMRRRDVKERPPFVELELWLLLVPELIAFLKLRRLVMDGFGCI